MPAKSGSLRTKEAKAECIALRKLVDEPRLSRPTRPGSTRGSAAPPRFPRRRKRSKRDGSGWVGTAPGSIQARGTGAPFLLW